jgi:hypothetical protein
VSGYVPLFDSLTRGTLCGRWPDIGLWPIVLSLSDRNGIVDVTQHYLAGVTGLAVEEVKACMARFCEADPHSRSKEAAGARLVLLEDHRDWGWRIVNHAYYREKARLAAKASREVAEGLNKSRMYDRRSPPKTAADPLSKLQTQTTNKTLKSERPLETVSEREQSKSAAARLPQFSALMEKLKS